MILMQFAPLLVTVVFQFSESRVFVIWINFFYSCIIDIQKSFTHVVNSLVHINAEFGAQRPFSIWHGCIHLSSEWYTFFSHKSAFPTPLLCCTFLINPFHFIAILHLHFCLSLASPSLLLQCFPPCFARFK